MLFRSAKKDTVWLVVGLGNPGRSYESTRHNVGFWAIDRCAEEFGTSVSRKRFHAWIGELRVEGQKVLLMKPQTFMNASGLAVAEAAKFYRIPPERVVVLSDDVQLDAGVLRIREGGSAGGQNGMKDVIAKLGSDRFPRVRIGVGKKINPEQPLADWVLSAPPAADREKIRQRLPDVAAAVRLILRGELTLAQSRYNG